MMYIPRLVRMEVISMYMLIADAADQIFLFRMSSATLGSFWPRSLEKRLSR